ncbi:MAG: response regulator transcription factor [Calditrichia bacterium]
MKIRIAIAEDDPMTRRQHLQRFSFFDHIEISMVAENGKKLLESLQELPPEKLPHLILMDIEMPVMDGIEAAVRIKELYPEINIMMQTVFKDEGKIFKSIQAGASGYLLKDCTTDELVKAVEDLQEGGVPLSRSIARKVLEYLRQNNTQNNGNARQANVEPSHFELTNREVEILQAIIRDETEYAIALNFGISQHTVRTHVKNIYKKLQVHSRGALVKAAYDYNLLKNNRSE